MHIVAAEPPMWAVTTAACRNYLWLLLMNAVRGCCHSKYTHIRTGLLGCLDRDSTRKALHVSLLHSHAWISRELNCHRILCRRALRYCCMRSLLLGPRELSPRFLQCGSAGSTHTCLSTFPFRFLWLCALARNQHSPAETVPRVAPEGHLQR